jgi:hypothetical protein
VRGPLPADTLCVMSEPRESLLFPDADEPARAEAEQALIVAYQSTGRTLDDLPYTDDFARLHRSLPRGSGDQRQVFHRLHNLRKAGKLPRLGKPETMPPKITAEEEEALRGLVVRAVGTLGQRDRLPYTSAMDALVQQFNAASGRSLDPHTVWRLVAKLAK